jgi:hypothetical protein
MTERELLDRTKQFALQVIKLVGALPRTIEGRAIANQVDAKRNISRGELPRPFEARVYLEAWYGGGGSRRNHVLARIAHRWRS